ncbi:MAG: DNA polymerase III subunit delta' [Lysobacterales bacterium]
MSYPWLQAVETEFTERLQGGRVAHAFLVSGPPGTGKGELAGRFMASLLCLAGGYPACGACRSCKLLQTGAHPDGHVVTFEQHPKKDELRTEIVIDQVRRLTETLQLTNTISRRKAALIFPAEAMNSSAANALLKTLEEPPGDATLLLVSHQPSRLPATIRSRCQALHVRLPEREAALAWLELAAAKALTEAANEAPLALEAAAGSPLIALRMLGQGETRAYRELDATLDTLRAGRCEPAAAMAAVAEIDPAQLWSWLSLRAARETRACLAGDSPDRPNAGRPSAGRPGVDQARRFADLQREADRNRRLVPTPVRKDLLLQDWLIQWSRLGEVA